MAYMMCLYHEASNKKVSCSNRQYEYLTTSFFKLFFLNSYLFGNTIQLFQEII